MHRVLQHSACPADLADHLPATNLVTPRLPVVSKLRPRTASLICLHSLLPLQAKEVQRLASVYHSILKSAGVELIEGRGCIKDAHTVEVEFGDGSKRTLRTKNILIATGGYATKVPIEGHVSDACNNNNPRLTTPFVCLRDNIQGAVRSWSHTTGSTFFAILCLIAWPCRPCHSLFSLTPDFCPLFIMLSLLSHALCDDCARCIAGARYYL